MLIKLIKYEMNKRWKAIKFILLGYILLQSLLLIVSRSILGKSNSFNLFGDLDAAQRVGTFFDLTMALYLLLALLIHIFPFIEGLYRFNKDLSGQQAVLELMMPIISWKKVVSKLITTLFSTAACVGLGVISIVGFAVVNGNFDQAIVDKVLSPILNGLQSPIMSLTLLLYSVFAFSHLYLLIFLCITFSKTLSHKNKVAVPIGIFSFVLCLAILMFLTIQVEKIPIYKYLLFGIENSLSLNILDLSVFIGALFGTSWLMDNKIEC